MDDVDVKEIAAQVATKMLIGDDWTVGDVDDGDEAFDVVGWMEAQHGLRLRFPLSRVALVRQSSVWKPHETGCRLLVTMHSGLCMASEALYERDFIKYRPTPAVGMVALEDAVEQVLWKVRRMVDQYMLLTQPTAR